MENVEQNEFKDNEILQDSMMFRMIQIAENSKRISDEYKNSHQNIPWNSLKGIRNIIVHDYGNVDYHIVYKTLKQDIPSLKRLLVNEEEKIGIL